MRKARLVIEVKKYFDDNSGRSELELIKDASEKFGVTRGKILAIKEGYDTIHDYVNHLYNDPQMTIRSNSDAINYIYKRVGFGGISDYADMIAKERGYRNNTHRLGSEARRKGFKNYGDYTNKMKNFHVLMVPVMSLGYEYTPNEIRELIKESGHVVSERKIMLFARQNPEKFEVGKNGKIKLKREIVESIPA